MQDDRLTIEELTEAQWQAAIDWVNVEPINYEFWQHDHSRFVIHQPTPDQVDSFNAALQAAG
jgi:hypothetical protein